MAGSKISAAVLFFALLSLPPVTARADPAALNSGVAAETNSDAPAPLQAQAAPKDSTLNIRIAPDVSKLDEAYQAAAKTLTPQQRDTVKALDAEFGRTMDADTRIIDMDFRIKYCAAQNTAIAKDPPKYQAEFGVYRNRLQAGQRVQRAALRRERALQTPFLDQKILDDHDAFNEKLMEGMAEGLLQAAFQRGAAEKTDCGDIAQKLDAAFSESRKQAGGADSGAAPEVSGSALPATAATLPRIQQAASGGDPDAMTTLGMMYISGNGTPKDADKGLALLQKAADAGYERAEYILGLSFATDMFGKAPDKEKAKYWLGKAADQGNKKAAAMLAKIDDAPPPESLEETRKKAEGGDAAAQYMLGARYVQGYGVEPDQKEGLKWMLLSAGQGDPVAESDVALQLLKMNRNAEAVDWMTKAATAGVTNSQFDLATLYREGKAVPKDAEKAAFWYGKAADAGDSRAARMLQQMGKP